FSFLSNREFPFLGVEAARVEHNIFDGNECNWVAHNCCRTVEAAIEQV
uniref:Amine oxidase n=1 Tax=Ascaris lumbricoides TaxID=6252 RepID=A0A0M3IVV0_ASCLU